MRIFSVRSSPLRGAPGALGSPWLALGLVTTLLVAGLAGGLPARIAAGTLLSPARASPPAEPADPSTSLPAAVPTAATAAPSLAENWVRLAGHGPAPVARSGAALAYDAADGYTVQFGGCGAHMCPLSDTWKFQAGTWTNLTSQLSLAPSPRTGAAFVYDSRDGYLLLFGGTGSAGPLSDTWKFVHGAWSPVTLTGGSPPARSFGMVSYDANSGLVLLFGGVNGADTPMGDTWTYSAGVWTQLTNLAGPSPPARSAAGFAFDATDGISLLFGGTSTTGAPLGDTWSFANGHWANLTLPGAPSARSGSVLVYDPGRAALVLYGGANQSVLADTWTFGQGAWTDLSLNLSVSPLARTGAAASYDLSQGYLFLYGGIDAASYRFGIWALLSPFTASIHPAAGAVAPGAGDTFQATLTGGLPPYNVTWNFGDGTPSGTGTSIGHTFQTAGTYGVSISAEDSLATTLSTLVNVTVRVPQLLVGLTSTPTAPRVGQTVTLTATAAGGTLPYAYHWGGATAGCVVSSASVLSCQETVTGAVAVSVTITDANGLAATASTNLSIAGATGSVANAPGATSTGGLSPWSASVAALVIALVITMACGVAVITYGFGRKQAIARATQRPLCYAVPAWSETPNEFQDRETADPLAGPWDRN